MKNSFLDFLLPDTCVSFALRLMRRRVDDNDKNFNHKWRADSCGNANEENIEWCDRVTVISCCREYFYAKESKLLGLDQPIELPTTVDRIARQMPVIQLFIACFFCVCRCLWFSSEMSHSIIDRFIFINLLDHNFTPQWDRLIFSFLPFNIEWINKVAVKFTVKTNMMEYFLYCGFKRVQNGFQIGYDFNADSANETNQSIKVERIRSTN